MVSLTQRIASRTAGFNRVCRFIVKVLKNHSNQGNLSPATHMQGNAAGYAGLHYCYAE